MQAGPYTEDFDFAIVDTPMHHALMHKSNFWSKIKSDLKPLEEHCVRRALARFFQWRLASRDSNYILQN